MAAQERTHLITAEQPAVAAFGADYFDTGRILCHPDGGCSAFVHGNLVYRDGAHLSVTGSMLFEPGLKAALHKLTSHASREVGRSSLRSRRHSPGGAKPTT